MEITFKYYIWLQSLVGVASSYYTHQQIKIHSIIYSCWKHVKFDIRYLLNHHQIIKPLKIVLVSYLTPIMKVYSGLEKLHVITKNKN